MLSNMELPDLVNLRAKITLKKWISYSALLIVFISLSATFWGYNHKIIDGDFDKLTVLSMEGIPEIIENQIEIDRIIYQINNSPRSFNPNLGFDYDYLPQSILIFENENEKIEVGFIITTGKVLTKYWEIETNLEF